MDARIKPAHDEFWTAAGDISYRLFAATLRLTLPRF